MGGKAGRAASWANSPMTSGSSFARSVKRFPSPTEISDYVSISLICCCKSWIRATLPAKNVPRLSAKSGQGHDNVFWPGPAATFGFKYLLQGDAGTALFPLRNWSNYCSKNFSSSGEIFLRFLGGVSVPCVAVPLLCSASATAFKIACATSAFRRPFFCNCSSLVLGLDSTPGHSILYKYKPRTYKNRLQSFETVQSIKIIWNSSIS